MFHVKHRPGLRLVLLGYVLLAIIYALLIPEAGNPDESAHKIFVRYLLKNGELPIFESASDNYEAHQPPLYYLLAVPFLALSKFLGGYRLIRLLSVVIGAVCVICTYEIAKRAFPKDEGIPLLSAAICGFLPSQLILSASISNDVLAGALFSLFTLLLIGRFADRLDLKTALTVGLVLGVGVLVKLSCCFLLPVGIVAVFLYQTLEKKTSPRELLIAIIVLCLSALIVCGWWLVRNLQLYGDPLAWGKFVEVFSKDRPTPDYFFNLGLSFSGYLGVVAVFAFKTFWGSFGQVDIFLPKAIYIVCCLVSLWILSGLAVYFWRPKDSQATEPKLKIHRLVLLLQVLLLGAALLRFNVTFFQAQARYLLPAISAIAIFMSVGLLECIPQRFRVKAAWIFSCLFFAYGLLTLLAWGLPGYASRGAPW